MKKNIYILICFALSLFSETGSGQERMIYLKGTAPFSMYSSNLDGTNEVLITTGVSNGGRCGFNAGKIYYISGSSIHKINMDGTGHTVIPNTNDAYGEINVSPSGDKIVYCGGTNNYYLYIIDTSGTNKILFNYDQPEVLHQTGPSWNTAGTIYFVLSNYGNPYTQKIYSKPDNDPSAAPVLLTSSFAHEPNSGGPNNLILFNNGSGEIATMNPDGSNQVILSAAGGGNYAKGVWHLSDSTFYYMHDNNIWKIKYNNTGNAQITTTGGIERVIGFGSFGPDVTVTASANPVCQGDTVTYTATLQPPDPNAYFQWYVNGNMVSGGTLNNGLISHYPLDSNALDLSGNGHHGTLAGTYQFQQGKKGQGLHVTGSLSGNGGHVDIPFINFNVLPNFSLSIWVNEESMLHPDGEGYLFYGNHFSHTVSISHFDNSVQFIAGSAVSNIDYLSGYLNNWVMYTLVVQNGTMKTYINDSLMSTVPVPPINLTTTTAAIGKHWWSTSSSTRFNGSFDDARIYSRALTASEVSLLYHGSSTYSYVPQPGDTVYCVATIPGSPPVAVNSNNIVMTVRPLPYDIGHASGLAAYYPFNGNANDESGNGNSTTIHGATPTTDRFGKADSAYYFDGVNDYIIVNNNTLGNLIDYSTISFWAYIDSTNFNNGDHFIIAKDWGPYWMYMIMGNIDSLNLGIYPGAHWFRYLGKNQVINNWHLFTFSKELGLYKVYFDGQLVAEYDAIINTNVINNDPICMGKSYYWNNYYFKGKLDDIRIYTRCLTSEEIGCSYTGVCNTLLVELESDTIFSGDNTALNILNSQVGIKYQVRKDGVDYGNDQIGNGSLISFPITYLTQTSSFTILATDPVTGCDILLDSIYTVTVLPVARDLHLTLFLEGLFNPVTGQMNKAQDEFGDEFPGTIADKIDVLMAGKEYPYPVLYSVTNAVLNQDGSCWVAIPRIGVYYLVIRHRNSIETWSSAPVSFATDPIIYDFSSLAGAAFGDNLLDMGGVYAIYTGDINQDGIVDSGDMNFVDNAATAVTYGYVIEDVNGDGIVDGGDMNLTDNNNTAVIIAILP